MKNIENKIREIAEKMGLPYIFDDWMTSNVRLDNTPLPCMVNVLPVSGSYSMRGNMLCVRANCLVAFLDKADFDFDGIENNNVIDRMAKYAAAFILLCNRSGYFETIGDSDIEMQIVYDKADVNVTGVILSLTLQEVDGICMSNDPLKLIGHGGCKPC